MLRVLDEIRAQVQETIEEVGKHNILSQKADLSKLGSLPVIAIYDTGFSFEKTGIGEAMGNTREVTKDEFSGDGNRTKFKLTNSAIRPLISVEAPIGNRLHDTVDYKVDYLNNEVIFRSAPPKIQKGKNNISVAYAVAKSAGEVKGIRLKVICNFDIYAKNSKQCDALTLDVVRSMLFAEDILVSKGIHVSPLGGNTLTSTDFKSEKIKDMCARRLVYRVETNIQFIAKVPRIEKIEITGDKTREIRPDIKRTR